jgi:hypothetical protein
MPHIRLEVPVEWLNDDFISRTGVDARQLLDHLAEAVCDLQMEDPAADKPGTMVPLINRKNLKHALIPVHHSGVGGDRSKGFLHFTFSAGNDKPGRTAQVRRHAASKLGHEIDAYIQGRIPELESVTVHVTDIDRDRGYTTTAERKKERESRAL